MLSSRTFLRASRAAAPRTPIARRSVPVYAVRSYAQAAAPQQSAKPPVPLFGIDGTYASALVSVFSPRGVLFWVSINERHMFWVAGLHIAVSMSDHFSQYTAAAKTSTLDTAAKALAALSELFKRDRKLSGILAAPTLTVSDKNQIVNELLKQTGVSDRGDTVKNFLKTLAENNRLSILEGVCEKFGTLISVHRGEVELLITSGVVCDIYLYIYAPDHDTLFFLQILLTFLGLAGGKKPLDNKTLSRLETAVSKSQYVTPGKKLKVTNKVSFSTFSFSPLALSPPSLPLSRTKFTLEIFLFLFFLFKYKPRTNPPSPSLFFRK